MKSMVNKLLICGVALIGIVYEASGTNVVVMKEITETDSTALPVPQVAPWQSGELQTGTRTFDLSVTGNCKINGESGTTLLVEGEDIIPDLFALDAEGNLVYAPYTPVATITMPRGHTSNVTITLESVRDDTVNTPDAKNYVCLSVRKKGTDIFLNSTPLYKISDSRKNDSISAELADGEVLEIIPRISKTNLSTSSCTPAVPGEQVTDSAGFYSTAGPFDLSSVYRILVTNTAG